MAIAHDASTSGGQINSSGSALTFSHTIGSGSDRLLVVQSNVEENSSAERAVSGVTYNGTALAKALHAFINESGNTIRVELWYLLEADLPAAGTYDVVITLASALDSGGMLIGAATSVTGADQGAPEVTNSSTNADSNHSTLYTTSITTTTDGAWGFDAMGTGQGEAATFTADSGQDGRTDQQRTEAGGARLATSTKPIASAGATTMGWTWGASTPGGGGQNRHAHVVAAWAPASTGVVEGEVAFAGSGTLEATAEKETSGAVALAGSGTLTASAQKETEGAVEFAGSGTLEALARRIVSGSVAFSGSGTVAADASRDALGVVDFAGAGTLQADASRIAIGEVAFAGSGTLTVVGTVDGEVPEAPDTDQSRPASGADWTVNPETRRYWDTERDRLRLLRDDEELLVML